MHSYCDISLSKVDSVWDVRVKNQSSSIHKCYNYITITDQIIAQEIKADYKNKLL